MFSNQPQGMSPEDIKTLRDLAGRYGSNNVTYTLRNITSPEPYLSVPNRNSGLSITSFGSDAPSLSSGPWSNSSVSICEDASMSGSFFMPSWDAEPALLLSDTNSLSGSEFQDQISPRNTMMMMKSPVSKAIECPMCAAYDVHVGFGRKSDFKKHLQNFHNTNSLWVCPDSCCKMVFDFEKAYITHFKIEHGDACPPADLNKVELCPQVVFACGFVGCKEVFEAASDTDAAIAAETCFDHLAGHFDKRSSVSSEWTYYHQVQNLLRQRSLKDEWKHSLWDKAARNQLRWQPRSSGDLKKLLECRHLPDVPKILHAAWTLGQTSFSSPEHPAPEFPGAATRPLRSTCAFFAKGHAEMKVVVPQQPAPHQNIFSLRRNLFPVKLATVSHPPPRSVPDEPDSLEYPHPGTPIVLPERDDWSTNVVLGPPEDEHLCFDPAMYPSCGNPIAPWSQSMGDLSPRTDCESIGPLLSVPKQKRPFSWGRRSLENLRLKRRGVEDKGASLPTWI
ncbi:hypothetical protein CkaCkLH20_06058 [Colletotrichum karsti]|uniref:C2H2-type domain-containing protein n=1 Tax=Colletotrichum karsti TaxID=1095194 RepID=A0A9P6I698_9PEZI|nr:uncharacterized protein CkaCkLH20_06058 [Colletotrichum karsti]KAF9876650.1 hypothetical protein CkaCkLH20_06058 [Colletotrichum karsti]